jgi:hypothetical protein
MIRQGGGLHQCRKSFKATAESSAMAKPTIHSSKAMSLLIATSSASILAALVFR